MSNKSLFTVVMVKPDGADRSITSRIYFAGNAPARIIRALKSNDIRVLKSYYPDWKNPKEIVGAADCVNTTHGDTNTVNGNDKVIGGDLEFDIEAALKGEKEKETVDEKIIVSNLSVYEYDTWVNLREKIHVTHVPYHAQHLFYIQGKTRLQPYRITHGGEINLDYDFSNPDLFISGLPIDKSLYDAKDGLLVETLENFQRLGDIKTVYCIDLREFFTPRILQIRDLTRDTYRFELFYYGFILKYWPQHSIESIRSYILDSADTYPEVYPELFPQASDLKAKYLAEKQLTLMKAAKTPVVTALTKVVFTISGGESINIRNLFDTLHTSENIPAMQAHVKIKGRKYILSKTHASRQPVDFPTGQMWKKGLVIAVLQPAVRDYHFILIQPGGLCNIKTTWPEDQQHDFQTTLELTKKLFNPLIAAWKLPIPKVGRRTQTEDLTACIFWKRVLTDKNYRVLLRKLQDFRQAGIINIGNTNYQYIKGVYQYRDRIKGVLREARNVEIQNTYAWLTDPLVRQKWLQLFSGRTMKITHRTTDIRIELQDIREDEYETAEKYISLLFSLTAGSVTNDTSQTTKRLKKLQEEDPILFDLKKSGSKKVYSILCQMQRQPEVITQSELQSRFGIRDSSTHDRLGSKHGTSNNKGRQGATAGKSDKRELTKYWNFTYDRPAWYRCPNPEYPFFSFIVGNHPSGYCLPCCAKKSPTEMESKRSEKHEICMDSGKYMEDMEKNSRHINQYGKELAYERLSKLNSMLDNILYDTALVGGYYVFGTGDTSELSFISALALSLDYSKKEFITGIIQKLPLITSLANGRLSDYFTRDELRSYLNAVYLTEETQLRPHIDPLIWRDFFVQMTLIAYNTATVFLEGESDITVVMDRMGINNLQNSNLIVLTWNQYCYPVFQLKLDRFYRSGDILNRTFDVETKIHSVFSNILTQPRKPQQWTIDEVRESLPAGSRIVEKYVNLHNLLYAVQVERSGRGSPVGSDSRNNVDINSGSKARDKAHVNSGSKLHKNTSNQDTQRAYIPVQYSVATSDGIPQRQFPEQKFVLEDLLDTIAEMPLRAEGLLHHNDALIGVKLSLGDNESFLAPVHSTQEGSNLPRLDVSYNFQDVNRAILSGDPPHADPRITDIGNSLHRRHSYRLFVLHFLHHIGKERNDEVRNRIGTALSRGDTTVLNELSAWDRMNAENGLLYNFSYEFDKITLRRLQSMHHDEREKELMRIARQFAVESDKRVVDFPNMMTTCMNDDSASGKEVSNNNRNEVSNNNRKGDSLKSNRSRDTQSYCQGSKLIVRDLQNFVQALAMDITLPIKFQFMQQSSIDNVVDIFQFVDHPEDIITVRAD